MGDLSSGGRSCEPTFPTAGLSQWERRASPGRWRWCARDLL